MSFKVTKLMSKNNTVVFNIVTYVNDTNNTNENVASMIVTSFDINITDAHDQTRPYLETKS